MQNKRGPRARAGRDMPVSGALGCADALHAFLRQLTAGHDLTPWDLVLGSDPLPHPQLPGRESRGSQCQGWERWWGEDNSSLQAPGSECGL